jgi:hypothetical protein
MRIHQSRPEYLKQADEEKKQEYLVRIPWITSILCATGSNGRYDHINLTHGALHSLLAGMMCSKKKDARYWLKSANGQLSKALKELQKPSSRMYPAERKRGETK